MGADDGVGGGGLDPAPLHDGLALGQVVGGVTVVAVGGDDEDDAVPLADGARHRARGLGRLVVRMGVDEDNG